MDENSTPSSPSKKILLSDILPPLPEGSRRLYLLRHGETEWNTLGKIQGGGHDIPLNENGKNQAEKTAHLLDDIPLDVIASSQLARAKETADILFQLHSNTASRVIDCGFAEMRFGMFEGKQFSTANSSMKEEFKKVSQQIKTDTTVAYPGGGESTQQVMERSHKALNGLLCKNPNAKHIAVVGHGRANKILLAAIGLGDVTKFEQVKQSSKLKKTKRRDFGGDFGSDTTSLTMMLTLYLSCFHFFVILLGGRQLNQKNLK